MDLAFRVASLASSSQFGNAFLIEGPLGTRILVDCGVRLRRTLAALSALDVEPSSIDAIFLTHEHQDHVQALQIRVPFAQRYGIPVYAPPGVWAALAGRVGHLEPPLQRLVTTGKGIQVGELQVSSFVKPHDAAEPVGYMVGAGGARCCVVTDLGGVPEDMLRTLRGSEYFIFESNHDPGMQRASGRPHSLIARILGPEGHLSNEQAATALARLATKDTRLVMLAHLSTECNTPALAFTTTQRTLSKHAYGGELVVLPGGSPTPFLTARVVPVLSGAMPKVGH